jgi:hypothetical protein
MNTLELAFEIIREHQKEAPINIEGIIRKLDIQLDKKAELDEHISGQIQKLPSGGYKISTNIKNHYFRQRFTMAHELGHYLFHINMIGDGVDDDMMFRSTPEGEFYNQSITQNEETEANQFAASVLMPKSLISELQNNGIITSAELAKKLQVSESAMKIRLGSLS